MNDMRMQKKNFFCCPSKAIIIAW